MHSRPFDLFVFANGDVADNTRMRDAGLFPWWVDPHLKLSFMRPLSSATHALDHAALWPDSAPLQLAHNLLWLALALVVAWAFYRRFAAPRWIAVLALALYAFDDARGPVVGWIANRNALVALVLAVPVLLVYDRWRRDGWAAGRWLGPVLFALALGAGESSVAILAFLPARTRCGSIARAGGDRIVALAPYLAIVIAWRLVVRAPRLRRRRLRRLSRSGQRSCGVRGGDGDALSGRSCSLWPARVAVVGSRVVLSGDRRGPA